MVKTVKTAKFKLGFFYVLDKTVKTAKMTVFNGFRTPNNDTFRHLTANSCPIWIALTY